MNDNLKEFWNGAKWILLAMFVLIVSLGDIYASIGYSKLHAIDPARYQTQGIYWVFGILNILAGAYYIWKKVSK